MKEELEKKLVEDYPELFKEYGMSAMESCMAWGCDCGDGWEPILRNLSATLNGQGSTSLKEKTLLPEMRKLKVWLHNLCRKIESKLNLKTYTLYNMSYSKYSNFSGFRVHYTQIKEKFGTLRVYTQIDQVYTPEEASKFYAEDIERHYRRFCGYVDGTVSFAENLSATTCEKCGEHGKISREGWWKTLCENCKNKK
jgi:hypothetical protein